MFAEKCFYNSILIYRSTFCSGHCLKLIGHHTYQAVKNVFNIRKTERTPSPVLPIKDQARLHIMGTERMECASFARIIVNQNIYANLDTLGMRHMECALFTCNNEWEVISFIKSTSAAVRNSIKSNNVLLSKTKKRWLAYAYFSQLNLWRMCILWNFPCSPLSDVSSANFSPVIYTS